MEKVWEELKKIEALAEQIRTEAQTNAKEITSLAETEAEKLVADSKIYAQQESQEFYSSMVSKAVSDREQQLKTNQQTRENLSKLAQRRMKIATSKIVAAVLGDT